MPWKLKLDEDGHAIVDEVSGLPLFVDDENGKESYIDPNVMHDKIREVGREAKTKRERAQKLESQLEAVKDIDDLPAFIGEARKAMDLVKNLEDSELVKAGDVEKIKKDAIAGLEKQEKQLKEQFASREQELQAQLKEQEADIRGLLISNNFATHPLFSGPERKTVLLPEFAESRFGSQFDVIKKDGRLRVVGLDGNGDPIQSRDPKKFGELADFDEAMDIIFSQHPKKDQLLRAGPGGSGASGGSDGVGKPTPLAELRKQHQKLMSEGRVEEATAIKTQIYTLQKNGG